MLHEKKDLKVSPKWALTIIMKKPTLGYHAIGTVRPFNSKRQMRWWGYAADLESRESSMACLRWMLEEGVETEFPNMKIIMRGDNDAL